MESIKFAENLAMFVDVAQAGSFSAVARRKGLVASSVARQIDALEQDLGVVLFTRSTRALMMTDAGSLLFERAVRILHDLRSVRGEVVAAERTVEGLLRVSCVPAFGRRHVVPHLGTLAEKHPGLRVELELTERTVDAVVERFDLVIRLGPQPDSSMVGQRIGYQRYLIGASPAYLRRHGVPLHPQDIERKGHRLVNQFTPGGRRVYAQEFNRDGERIELTMPYRIAVNEVTAHTSAVLAGLGLSQMLTFIAEPHRATGALVQVLPEWSRDPLPVYVVYPPNRHLSAKVRAFVDWAAELFARHPHLQRA